MQLEQFLAGQQKASWVRIPHTVDVGSVYMRKARRSFSGQMWTCLDVATIRIEKRYRRKGIFKRFLANLESMQLEQDAIYVENVMDQWFRDWFEREGWIRHNYIKGVTCSYFKWV